MRRLPRLLALVILAFGLLWTSPASAGEQSLNLYIGGFMPRGADGRVDDDVLFRNQEFLFFDISQFNGATVGAEWLVALGDHVDAGLGVGFYANTVPAVYTYLINDDGSEIAQDLRLRITPVTATVRFLPLGRRGPVRPYIGAGASIYWWRYSETGQFVDANDSGIFYDTFAASGTDVGPVVFGGITVPVGPAGIGTEIRYQAGTGELPPDLGFAGSAIDLGGLSVLATVSFRF